MKVHEHTVHFETITPLRFGDAWLENKAPSKASAIMGSLRFWFEVICYLSGITKPDDYSSRSKEGNIILKANLEQKEFQDKLKTLMKETESNLSMEELIGKLLQEMKIPLPARVFGCTGWRGLIQIKEIKLKEQTRRFNLSSKVGISKSDPYAPILKNDYCPPRSNLKYSVHYFPDGFYGSFDVIFLTDKNTAQHILFPLLKFIERYGFVGGAWNSGYGRVKVNFEHGRDEYNRFSNYAEFVDNPVNIDNLIEKVQTKNDLLLSKKTNRKLRLFTLNNLQKFSGESIESILEEKLIKEKVYLRRYEKNKDKRHQIFGTTSSPVQGSKILPWIYEVNNKGTKWEYGFISIVDILNIGKSEVGENES